MKTRIHALLAITFLGATLPPAAELSANAAQLKKMWEAAVRPDVPQTFAKRALATASAEPNSKGRSTPLYYSAQRDGPPPPL